MVGRCYMNVLEGIPLRQSLFEIGLEQRRRQARLELLPELLLDARLSSTLIASCGASM